MFIPLNHLPDKTERNAANQVKARLKASHLILKHELVIQAFGAEQNVYMTYDSEKKTLRIAPVSNQLFTKIYTEAGQYLLKDKNIEGDKSIALHDILIDHELNSSDRELDYAIQDGKKVLNISL